MSNDSGQAIEINLTSQQSEKKQENAAPAAGGQSTPNAEEMPGVTMLLQRKKLSDALKKPAENAGVQPTLEAVPEAILTEMPSGDPAAPNISVSGADAVPDFAPNISTGEDAMPSGGLESDSDDMPQISAPARRRGAKVLSAQNDALAGGPPQFRGTLALEPVDFKGFQKRIKKNKKSSNMKKLACLDYFSSRFSEIAYFEVSAERALTGVLGFGNGSLVENIRSQFVTPELLPSIFEVLSSGEFFVGAIESLRAEDQSGFLTLGFSATTTVGAFPITYKKAVTGLWLCGASQAREIDQKELKALKKFFSDLVL